MKTLRGLVAGGLAAVILSMGGLEARTWTSASDASKVLEGELIGSDGTNIEIKLANGKTIKAPLTAFIKADQDFVAAQAKPEPGAAKAAPPKPGDLEPINLEIWNARLCCSRAEKMYEDAVRDVEGVTYEFGKSKIDKKILILDCKTRIAAREALANIASAGIFGETDSQEVRLPGARNTAKGDMTATGVVYCCNKSVEALEKAVLRSRGSVDGEKGVTEHTIRKSKDTFEIKGTATANEVLRHARDVGFNFTLENFTPPPEN